MPLTQEIEVRVRPTLLVGLGGRGCRTVTDTIVKLEELLGGEGAELPPFVQVLGIDSTWDPREHSKIGEGRFVHIKTGGLSRLRESVVRGERAAIGAWFDASMDVPQLNGTGLAGNRHLGALAFAANCQFIYDRLAAALDALVEADLQERTVSWQQEHGHKTRFVIDRAYPQVLLISSTCGGTGAGLMLDVAALVSMHAERTGGQSTEVTTTAFVYLPDTWDQVTEPLRRQWYINTYAMLMEIDAVHSGQSHFRFRRLLGSWGAELPSEVEVKSGSPFAAIYLINGHGTEHGSHFPEQLIIDRVSSFVASLVMQPGGAFVRNDQINIAQASLGSDPTMNYLGFGYSDIGLSSEEAQRLVTEELYRRALEFVGGRAEGTAPEDLERALGWERISLGPHARPLSSPTLFGNVRANRGIIQRAWEQHCNSLSQEVNLAIGALGADDCARQGQEIAQKLIAEAVEENGLLGGAETAREIARVLERLCSNWRGRASAGAAAGATNLTQARASYGNAMAASTAADQDRFAREAWDLLNSHVQASAEQQWFEQAAQMADTLRQDVELWADVLQDAATWSAAQAISSGAPVVSRLLPIAWDEFVTACTAGGGLSEEKRCLREVADRLFGPRGLAGGAGIRDVLMEAAAAVVRSVEWSVRHRLTSEGRTGRPLLSELYEQAEPMIEHDTVRYPASEMGRFVELEGVADEEVLPPPYASTVRNCEESLVPGRIAVLSMVGRFPLASMARVADWRDRYWEAQRHRRELLRAAGHSGINPHIGICWWLPDLFEPDKTYYPGEAASILAIAVALGALRVREEVAGRSYWEWARDSEDGGFVLEDMLRGAGDGCGVGIVERVAKRVRGHSGAGDERLGAVALRLVAAIPPNWPRQMLRDCSELFERLCRTPGGKEIVVGRIGRVRRRLDVEMTDETIERNRRLIEDMCRVLDGCVSERDEVQSV